MADISNKTFLGRLIRFPLSLIPKNAKFPILRGTLKGYKWITGSSTHGCWIGTYENEIQKCFGKYIKEGNIVFDIGANVGFFTLLASALVGRKGKVYAFEPFPENVRYLKEHIRINNINNVVIQEAAVSDRNGECLFCASSNQSMGHISLNGNVCVETLTLDALIERSEISAPNLIKIDVEGAEFMVLTGAKNIISRFHPTILLETHGSHNHKQCCEFLEAMGYHLCSLVIDNRDYVHHVIALN